MKLQKIFSLTALILFSFYSQAQKITSITPERPIVCYSDPVNRNTSFGPPEAFLKARNYSTARTQTAIFEVTYSAGFTPQAKTAFQFAVDIWASILQSPVKIKINAVWQPLGANVLGSAIWANAYANFPNAQKLNTYYPVALAEKIAQKDLNHPDSADIYANFSSSTAWYYGTSGIPPANTTDLVSVVLHEIGHGLGFVDSYSVDNGTGSVAPFVYDLGVENNNTIPQNLYQNFTNPSAALGTELISNKIFYNSLLANQANGGQHVKLYAPATWSGGSSISHLDENTYPAGDPNSLMTPQIGFKEVMHDPGPIMLGMFSDMGWMGTRIDHTPSNKESLAANSLIAKVTTDNVYSASSVKLKYIKMSGGAEVELVGTPTANANEFSFPLPAFTNPDTIFYYITATDNLNRAFTNPGKFVRAKNTELQGKYTIGFGTDTKGPVINHTAKAFILASATSLQIDAIVSDNIGVQSVSLDYSINNAALTTVAMAQVGNISTSSSNLVATSSSKYTAPISFANGVIKDGDIITYQITAKDNSLAQNSTISPTISTKYSVNVVGLTATKDSYQNNFNDLLSADFFGDTQFSIKKETGFVDGAIHSIHPYPEAGSGPNLNFIYELRVPIKVKTADASIKFDEIVLVEPGDPGTRFGDAKFYDYVIVEGSTDGGANWKPFIDGYDSRDYTPWLTKYNGSIISNISQGIGDPSLFRPRTINMLNKFKAGDEVVIRFRLFSDPGAAGWGWAIDNLKIQIDETPPTTLHNHFDYVTNVATPLPIAISATDPSGLKSLTIEYKVNNGAVQSFSFPVSNSSTQYNLDLTISSLAVNDLLEYRIISVDNLDNALVLPTTDFFKVPVIAFGSAVSLYTSDFNSTNTDFVGNFFSIATPAGFTDGAIHSTHPYPNGFGTNNISLLTYTLKKPVTVSNTNHIMVFNEMVIAESTISNEYAVVEGSKDNGITWEPLVDKYSSSAVTEWLNTFNSKQNGIPSLYKLRIIDLTQNGKFKAGDNILIRFKFSSNATNNAWGWAIDNLSIQGPITGVERNLVADALSIYPNPSTGATVHVEFATEETQPIKFQMLNSFGQLIQENTVTPAAKFTHQEYDVTSWANGIYIVKAEVNGIIITKKFIKAQ